MQNNAKSTLLKSLQSIALCSGQIVVPKALQQKTIMLAHEGHQGLLKRKLD